MIAYRIGHQPRMSRFQRAARVFDRFGSYALGWGVFATAAWAAYWDLWVAAFAVLYLASVLCSPWRPKRPVRPGSQATRAAFHSRLWRFRLVRLVGALSPLPPG